MPRRRTSIKKKVKPLTEEELEQISAVFHQYETGVRSGRIRSVDLLSCMKSVGMNPSEQELVDMTNEVEKKGVIYFDDVCKLILRKFREDDEEEFIKIMFKHLCGTDPHPTQFRAKKYKVEARFIEKKDFLEMMQLLPTPVDPEEAEEMFDFADKDRDCKISWEEFQIMINPPPPPKPPTPHKEMLAATFLPEPIKPQETKTKDEKKDEAVTEESDTEEKQDCPVTPVTPVHDSVKHSDDKKHRDKCTICQSKVVKPIVETDISRAASSFAKDSTLIKYSWRNEKATFKEKKIEIATEKMPGHDHEADHIFIGLPTDKCKL